MHRKNKLKAIVAFVVALAFVMPVAAFANFETIGLTDNENTGDMEIMVESTNSGNSIIVSATGVTWYVGSGPGNDSATIQGGINLAGPGDTVYVYNGIYNEKITVTKQLDLIGESRENTIIDGGGPAWLNIVYVTASGVNISNFTVQGQQKYSIYYNTVSGGTVRNCDISGSRQEGIYINKVSGANIINCNVYNSGQYGIYILWSSENNIIDCDIYNSGKHGIYIYQSSNKNNIINCNVYSNYYCGILLDGSGAFPSNNNITECNAYNNNIAGSTNMYGICLKNSLNCKLEGNTIYDNYYNFGVEGGSVSYFNHDIGPSNTVNGKPIYWLFEIKNETFDEIDFGFLGMISCKNVTVKNADTYGIMMVSTTDSTISNVNSYNSTNGIYLRFASSNNDIINCNFYNSGEGIYLYGSSYNNITNCNVYDSESAGINLNANSNNNIITNCNTYGMTYGSGIWIYASSNNALINCKAYNNSVGFTIYGLSYSTSIVDCDVYNNSWYGIKIEHSATVIQATNVMRCNAYNNGKDGIYIKSASGNIITNCNSYGNGWYGSGWYGFRLVSSSGNVLRGNAIFDNANDFGIEGTAIDYFNHDIDPTNTVSGKRIYYLVNQNGDILDGSYNIGFLGLISCTNILVMDADVTGVLIAGTTGSTISDVNSHDSVAGIYLFGSSGNTVMNCNAYNNGKYGIHLRSSSNNNDIINCNAYNNVDYGIFIEYSSNNNDIINCDAYNNKWGIHIFQSSGNTFTNCDAYNNQQGFRFQTSPNSNIVRCNIYSNSQHGIYIYQSSNGHKIYHNNFVGNSPNAYDVCSNTWDDGYPSGGNYWADYTGVDEYSGPGQNISGSDGIGDTPYSISGGSNKDKYPLMVILDNTPPVITDVVLTTSSPLDTNAPYGWENVTCTVTDNIAVGTVKLVVTNPDATKVEYTMIKTVTDIYYYNTTLTQLGYYGYYIWANDVSSNDVTTPSKRFVLPMNEDVDMNGQVYFNDLVLIVWKYGNTGDNGWVREDVDNNGQVYFDDLVLIVWHYGEWWK